MVLTLLQSGGTRRAIWVRGYHGRFVRRSISSIYTRGGDQPQDARERYRPPQRELRERSGYESCREIDFEVKLHDKIHPTSAYRLFFRNEKSSKTYTTKLIADMIHEEAKGRFESRTSVPGHVQQGGTPSPMDRVRAVRLAVRCVQFLEDNVRTPKEILADPSTASVIGIKGAAVVFSSISVLEKEDTDWKERRPKSAFWLDYTDIANTLGGRKGTPSMGAFNANFTANL